MQTHTLAETRYEWGYEINDEMLTDEQIMALPWHYEPRGWVEALADYADALLAQQDAEKRLGEAWNLLTGNGRLHPGHFRGFAAGVRQKRDYNDSELYRHLERMAELVTVLRKTHHG